MRIMVCWLCRAVIHYTPNQTKDETAWFVSHSLALTCQIYHCPRHLAGPAVVAASTHPLHVCHRPCVSQDRTRPHTLLEINHRWDPSDNSGRWDTVSLCVHTCLCFQLMCCEHKTPQLHPANYARTGLRKGRKCISIVWHDCNRIEHLDAPGFGCSCGTSWRYVRMHRSVCAGVSSRYTLGLMHNKRVHHLLTVVDLCKLLCSCLLLCCCTRYLVLWVKDARCVWKHVKSADCSIIKSLLNADQFFDTCKCMRSLFSFLAPHLNPLPINLQGDIEALIFCMIVWPGIRWLPWGPVESRNNLSCKFRRPREYEHPRAFCICEKLTSDKKLIDDWRSSSPLPSEYLSLYWQKQQECPKARSVHFRWDLSVVCTLSKNVIKKGKLKRYSGRVLLKANRNGKHWFIFLK